MVSKEMGMPFIQNIFEHDICIPHTETTQGATCSIIRKYSLSSLCENEQDQTNISTIGLLALIRQ